jgi:hypothetical protein
MPGVEDAQGLRLVVLRAGPMSGCSGKDIA